MNRFETKRETKKQPGTGAVGDGGKGVVMEGALDSTRRTVARPLNLGTKLDDVICLAGWS